MNLTERNVLVWLSSIGGVCYKSIEGLIEYFGSICEVWDAKPQQLRKGMNKNSIIAERMIKNRSKCYFDSFIEKTEALGITIKTLVDVDYPQQLKVIYDLPYVIYLKGNCNLVAPLVAIVGSRKASSYGMWAAQHFALELSRLGIGVVSGLALGIDTAAHKGVVEAKGKTIAVLGCGVDYCYPASNQRLYSSIYNDHGTILSEYPPGTPPLKHHFPARNRIISGLSEGIIIIEAGEKSGALITVEYGLEQGKEIYALPGNINNAGSIGTNRLIKEGAKILTSIEDILEDLRNRFVFLENKKSAFTSDSLSYVEKRVYSIISNEPIHIDLIALKSGIRIKDLNSLLTILEIKGLICQLPGKIFTVN